MMLITGSGGRLGRELSILFPGALKPSSRDLDVNREDSVRKYIAKAMPDIVIHLAAMTSVPECERDKSKAWTVNVKGTINMLGACQSANPACYFMLMSTPCVFRGDKGMYTEDDTPDPDNFYGATKAMAEAAVQAASLKTLIVRGNFVPREKWPYEGAFTDRWGTYLFADDLAKGIKKALDENRTGILHIAGDRKMSMYELAKITTPDVKPISYADYLKKGGVKLTQDMTLDSNRWGKLHISE
ncbi:MAG: sugar nucleotide-binding protein [Candidatus Aenigmarchaeota archaeon]|nr:sugar nucleotide-binding protein [Candidatus Aenigmarchaeota archaeon]